MHRISFVNLAKALILLNFPASRINFVYEPFECKNCLTFDTRYLLAISILRTER